MRTIGRNQRAKAERIFAGAKNILSYTLNGGFSGELITRSGINDYLLSRWDYFQRSKLIYQGNNKYMLKMHSNEWYVFESLS